MTLVVLLSSGITFYVTDSGTKTSCRNGFQYMESGDYEGYWKCTTLSGERYEMCFEVYNSTNTENYWCKKGLLVEQPKEDTEVDYEESTGDWICHPPPINRCYLKIE